VLGKSGMTGLAGGDHLHFTTLVGGLPVTPTEWWDRRWVRTRIVRPLGLGFAFGGAPAAKAARAPAERPSRR
jgi:hypothetical protein